MPTAHTQKSRQPQGMVGYMKSRLSLIYAMANSLTSDIETHRVAARVFGLRQQAGLEI